MPTNSDRFDGDWKKIKALISSKTVIQVGYTTPTQTSIVKDLNLSEAEWIDPRLP
ncbi:hypothetical protein SOVF_197700, partial [Spinacia oleracea]